MHMHMCIHVHTNAHVHMCMCIHIHTRLHYKRMSSYWLWLESFENIEIGIHRT